MGWEDSFVRVIRRIAHRNEPGYFRWAQRYFKPVRNEFERHLRPEELAEADVDWANRGEEAAWQDCVHNLRTIDARGPGLVFLD